MQVSVHLQRVTRDTKLVQQCQNPRAEVPRPGYKCDYLISTCMSITFLNLSFQVYKNEANDP